MFHIIFIAKGKLGVVGNLSGPAFLLSSSVSFWFSSTSEHFSLSAGNANGAAASYTAALQPFPICFPMT